MIEGSRRKVILIDLGGVVQKGWLPLATNWSERTGFSTEELLSAIYGGNDETVLIGAMSEDDWWKVVEDRLRLPTATLKDLRAALIETYSWDEEIVGFLRSLRGIVPTALVSNAWPLTLDRLKALGVGDIVDEFVISGDVGFRKPDPRIYKLALDRLNAQAFDAIFIDDSPEYVVGAEALGIVGHLHRNTSDSIARIRDFLRDSD